MNSSTPNGEIFHGRTVKDVPNKKIKDILPGYVSALCSPSDCFSKVHKNINYKTANRKEDVSQMTIVDGNVLLYRFFYTATFLHSCYVKVLILY